MTPVSFNVGGGAGVCEGVGWAPAASMGLRETSTLRAYCVLKVFARSALTFVGESKTGCHVRVSVCLFVCVSRFLVIFRSGI